MTGLLLLLTQAASAQESSQTMSTMQKAVFAGGCFWCMEGPFEQLEGVVSVTSGYTGGTKEHPTYQEVSAGTTGHAEAIEVRYDSAVISYEQLLEVLWRNVDPTQPDGQFADHGSQYRTAIFYHDEQQRQLAEASKQQLAASGKFKSPIVTEILPASTFYPAEDYHQDYYKKHSLRYKLYHEGSGRAGFLRKVWGTTGH